MATRASERQQDREAAAAMAEADEAPRVEEEAAVAAAAAAVPGAVVAAALPNSYAASEDEDEPLEEVDDAVLDDQVAAAQAAPDPEEEDPVIFAEQTILFDIGNGQDVELEELSMEQLKAQLKRYKESTSGSKTDLQRRLSWQINKNSADPKYERTIRLECTLTAKKCASAPEGHFFVNVDYKGVKLKDVFAVVDLSCGPPLMATREDATGAERFGVYKRGGHGSVRDAGHAYAAARTAPSCITRGRRSGTPCCTRSTTRKRGR